MGTLSYYSCADSFSTTVEIEAPPYEKAMVFFTLNSIGDTSIIYNIGRNRALLEAGDISDFYITDADVFITNLSTGVNYNSDDNAIDFDQGFFNMEGVSTDFFKSGEQYQYVLEHPDFPRSETTLTFPNQGELIDISYKYIDGIDEEGDEASSLTFTIVDDPDEINFYEFEARTISEFDPQQIPRSFWVFTADPVAEKGIPDDNLFFKDESFNGETKEVTVKFDRSLFDPDSDNSLDISWRSINQGYYNYLITLDRSLISNDNPFVAPVQVTTNVNEGFGAIGLRNEVIYQVQ